MHIRFEWDRRKALANLAKHRVSFDEASTAFGDPLASTFVDPEHSVEEERLVTFGLSEQGRILAVLHIEVLEPWPHEEGLLVIRIISAREATRRERIAYEEGQQ